ncbi:MAG: protein-export chaperone SecB [Gammaproteobacteria bacterium]|nr:protein-export chaperone SecB [Gammaproteobacteria bacterium]MDH5653519.1 protein-export chaperone SecB [Gammaproteobacteria bacterium]
MSSEENKQPEQHFEIQKIYVKDISLEVPHTPDVFTRKWEPDINIQLNTQARALEAEADLYEVVLSITVNAKNSNENAFLIELQQAGVFTIKGFNAQDLGTMLGSFSPNILFPYAREAISDLAVRGGFPQLLLAPVNFDALYAETLKQQAQKAAGEQETAH